MAGKGRPSKYSPEMLELAKVLCQQTGLTAKESARLLKVPTRTLQFWWEKLPLPPHRKGIQGGLPDDPVAAMEAKVKSLEAELLDENRKIEEATGENPMDTSSLIQLARLRLQERLGPKSSAKMGEVAASLRVLVEVRKEEIDAEIQDRCKIVYYIPGGVCPSCGVEAKKIRPEDLFGEDQPDMSRPN